MQDDFIAHLRQGDQNAQSLSDHLLAVSALCGEFAARIGLRETGELIGFFHDQGKASRTFQAYLRSAAGLIDPDNDAYIDAQAQKGKIDHSSAGAQILYQKLQAIGREGPAAAQTLALCIASHHSGLIDCLSPDGNNAFKKRIEKSDEFTHTAESWSNLISIENEKISELLSKEIGKQLVAKLVELRENNDSKSTLAFKQSLLIRFLFSCLIDADRLNTANFEVPDNRWWRNQGHYRDWKVLIARLDQELKRFENNADKNDVDNVRDFVSQQCFAFSTHSKGVYQLTVPTGGGKTLASLRFALNHAEQHRMERIIYVIPYTSIIDQNAQEARRILEDRDKNGQYLDWVVLEHHSNLTPEEETRRQHLLAEN